MDVLSDQLARARARGAVFSTLRRVSPWGLEFGGQRLLTVHILLDGTGWLICAEAAPVRLDAGDVLLATAGERYRLVSDIDAEAETITEARRRGSDQAPGRASTIMCGAYTVEGSVGTALLGSLPRFVQVPAQSQSTPHRHAISLLDAEADGEGPGQQVLLDRLLDLNLVYALRAWWQMDKQRAPGWYRALAHPGLAAVVRAVHERPARRWTLADMAQVAAMSRAGFAAAFREVVGTSPGSYLTELRMGLAEDALLRTDATVSTVAADVGYGNEFAFATAFRRTRGLPPGRWRTTHRRDPAAKPVALPAADS